MPYLKIQTNVEIDPASRQPLVKQLSATVAELLDKSENYVMVALEENTPMCFAADDAPCAYLELKSLGLPEQETARFSEVLCDVVSGALDIPTSRIYLEFSGPPRHMWGWDRRTFG